MTAVCSVCFDMILAFKTSGRTAKAMWPVTKTVPSLNSTHKKKILKKKNEKKKKTQHSHLPILCTHDRSEFHKKKKDHFSKNVGEHELLKCDFGKIVFFLLIVHSKFKNRVHFLESLALCKILSSGITKVVHLPRTTLGDFTVSNSRVGGFVLTCKSNGPKSWGLQKQFELQY